MMTRFVCLILACLFATGVHGEFPSAVRRVQAHLILKDYQAAYAEAQQAVASFPHSLPLREELIKSLAKLGREKEMLQEWEKYVQLAPDQALNRPLIEEMAWGILTKASCSPSLIARLMAALAAFFSQDVKGVEILHQRMQDSNAAIRAVAVKLAGHYSDAKLKEAIHSLFKQERVWLVRKEIIEAIGRMKLMALKSDLERLIASNQSLAEEKALAIEALIALLKEIKREEVVRLAHSDRAALRLFACRAIGYFGSVRDQDLLLELGHDCHADVRAAALQALGMLRLDENQEQRCQVARTHLKDKTSKVAISAAWLLTLYCPAEGQQALRVYLNAPDRETRLLAAAALTATGRYGAPLAIELLTSHLDSYVRLNLAVGLLGQRLQVTQAAAILDQVMRQEREKWTWKEEGIFKPIGPNCLQKGERDDDETTPEEENQLVRLQLLNQLAIVRYPPAQESIRRFLIERQWGISGTAAALLLTEGDDYAVELVKELLTDLHPKIRLQSALILSLWSRDEEAVEALEKAYENAERESKEKILEGLGRIGSIRSVPFLINKLKESSQGLRIIAAMALIQCLNH